MIKTTASVCLTAAIALGCVVIPNVAMNEPGVALAQKAEEGVWPKGSKAAAEKFTEHLTGKYLTDKIAKWTKGRSNVTDGTGVPPIVITVTSTGREVDRTHYYVESFDKKGNFVARRGDFYPGTGLMLGKPEVLNFARLKADDASLERLFSYHSDTRNDEAGNALLAGFAAWLYENGAPWAGNRALALLQTRAPKMENEIAKEIRARHKFSADEALVATKGPGFNNWAELIPESKKEERLKEREAAVETELKVAMNRAKLSLLTADRITWEIMTASEPTTKGVLGLSLAQLELELVAAERFADGSAIITSDKKTWEDNKDNGKSRVSEGTFAHWKAEVLSRMAKSKVVLKEAESKFGDADAKRKEYAGDKKEGKGGEAMQDAFDLYDKAEVELRKLLPTKESAKGPSLDPFNMLIWMRMVETLRYSCRPHERAPDKCDKESKVREALAAADVVLRAFPKNPNTMVSKGQLYLMTRDYTPSRKVLEEVANDESQPANYRKQAKDYITNVLDPVEKSHREKQAIKNKK